MITMDTRVGDLARTHPMSTRVLARHGIDFCCGGGKSLKLACDDRGIDATVVVAELESELASSPAAEIRWDTEPAPRLIEHILARYHKPLKEELPRLAAMADKVQTAHGARDPERFQELRDIIHGLAAELLDHMLKEERILFPRILAGMSFGPFGPIDVMESEHEQAGAQLRRIRELTGDFTLPDEACATWRALWAGLEELERDTHEHIHLENNILFPRARKTG